MPDAIRPRDRALIDAELAAGRVTVCPAGGARGGIYDLPTRREIIRRDTAAAISRRAGLKYAESLAPAIERRRKAVIEMSGLGKRAPEIARFLGVPVKTIHADMRAIRREAGL